VVQIKTIPRARQKMMGLELSIKKIVRGTKLQECWRHDPDNFNKQASGEAQRDGVQVSLAGGNGKGSRQIRYRASSVVAGPKLEALSNWA
jgi:hypothetical protein